MTQEDIRSWWHDNGMIIVMIATSAILGAVAWGNLSTRVGTIEMRGSPQIEQVLRDMEIQKSSNTTQNTRISVNENRVQIMDNRLTRLEERQAALILTINQLSTRIDELMKEIRLRNTRMDGSLQK